MIINGLRHDVTYERGRQRELVKTKRGRYLDPTPINVYIEKLEECRCSNCRGS